MIRQLENWSHPRKKNLDWESWGMWCLVRMMKVREKGPEIRDPFYLFKLDKEEGPSIMTMSTFWLKFGSSQPCQHPSWTPFSNPIRPSRIGQKTDVSGFRPFTCQNRSLHMQESSSRSPQHRAAKALRRTVKPCGGLARLRTVAEEKSFEWRYYLDARLINQI